MTYLTDSNYLNRYIRNRMTNATVTTSAGTITAASAAYDEVAFGALQDAGSLSMHDNTNYGTGFTYRGNPTSSSTYTGGGVSTAYATSGIPYKTQHASGPVVTTSTDSSTAYSLPSVIVPNGNTNLQTTFSYTSSFQVSSVTGANGTNTNVLYDTYGHPTSSTSVDGATTYYTYSSDLTLQTAGLGGTTTWKTTKLDGFGRAVQVQTGHDSTVISTVDTRYAPCGCSPLAKLSQASNPYGPADTEVWTTYGTIRGDAGSGRKRRQR